MAPLTKRLEKGSPLTSQEGDNNWSTIEDFVNALAEMIGVSLNDDGTLKVPQVVRGNSTNGTHDYACTIEGTYATAADLVGKLIVIHVDTASNPTASNDFPTVTFNGTIGPLNIKRRLGTFNTAETILPSRGDIRANQEIVLTYDPIGACLILHNPTSNPRGNFAPSSIVSLAANDYAVTLPDLATYLFDLPQAYYAGYELSFIAANSLSSISPEPTLKVACSSPVVDLTAKTIKKYGNVALQIGDIISGRLYRVIYDGTYWQLINPMESTATFTEEQSSGVSGGTFTSGAWRTRLLNTTKHNGITGASIASNQVTLPAGTYRVRGFAVGGCSGASAVGLHQARLYNITGAATLVVGSSSRTTTSVQNVSVVNGRFTLTVASVIELQHQCGTTLATSGFGLDVGFSEVNVFSEVELVLEG